MNKQEAKSEVDRLIKEFSLENLFFQKRYTQLWNDEFQKNTQGIKVDFVLEIGCFEGLTSNYICDNLLKKNGRLVCVDPLSDTYTGTDDSMAMFAGQYERFMANTVGQPIELIRKKSSDAYPDFINYLFDFIYIDGDHSEEAVYQDGVMAFNVLRRGGNILFDDYKNWSAGTRKGIDRFIKEYKERIEIGNKGYQIMIKKTAL